MLPVLVWDVSAARAFPLAFYVAGGIVVLRGFTGMIVAAFDDFPWPRENYLASENKAARYGMLGTALFAVGVLLEVVL